MNKVFSIFLILALSFQSLNATNLLFGIYSGNSYRVILQNYHHTYLYSKIGFDYQYDENLNKNLPYIYLSLGIPVIESIVKIPLSDDIEIGHNRHSNTRGFAFSLEKKYETMITGIFLEMPLDPERFRFGYYIGASFDNKINNEKSTTMDKINEKEKLKTMNNINKYATYTIVAAGTIFIVSFLALLSTAGKQ